MVWSRGAGVRHSSGKLSQLSEPLLLPIFEKNNCATAGLQRWPWEPHYTPFPYWTGL